MKDLFDRRTTEELARNFAAVQRYIPLQPISTTEDYLVATSVLRELLEMGAGQKPHPLAGICGVLGVLVSAST